jgi:DNA invertase Pin-like site-specific DNA recombinase
MKNVLVYSRVSTDEQAKTGYSLPDQEAKLKAFCVLKRLNIVGTFREDYSAKTFDRPQWRKILEFIRTNKGQVDTILFSRWDRFSRNAEESYGMFVTLRKLGVQVQAFEQPLDLSIPENKFMLAFYLTQPEVDNDRRAMNILSGIRRARMEGRWTQQAPMGYRNTRDEHNKPIIVPSKDAKHIIYTFKETAKGVKNQEEIRQELLKKGFNCSKQNFYKLVRNKVYIGLVRVKADKNEPEHFVKGIHEPLITSALFYQAQNMLDERNRFRNQRKSKRKREDLLLRGFLYCPHCSEKVTGSKSKGATQHYFYYHCNHCGKFRAQAPEVNESVVKLLQQIKVAPQVKELYKAVFIDAAKEIADVSAKEVKSLNAEIQKLETRKRNVQDLLSDGRMEIDQFNDMMKRYNAELDKLQALKGQNQKLPAQKEIAHQLTGVLDFIDNLAKCYEAADMPRKHQIISSTFSGKLIFDGNESRTTETNEVIELLSRFGAGFRGKKKRLKNKISLQSLRVDPERIELSSYPI